MNTAELIKEYVTDHYNHFGFYPYDVAVNGKIYSYDQYNLILEEAWTLKQLSLQKINSRIYTDLLMQINIEIKSYQKLLMF